MAVINLGNYASPEENPIGAGLRSAGESIRSAYVNRAALQTQERIASADRASREKIAGANLAQDRAVERNRLSATLATEEAKEVVRNTNLQLDMYDRFSSKVIGMSQVEVDAIASSEFAIAAAKGMKKYVPDLVDENGKMRLIATPKPWEPQTREAKIEYEADLAAAIKSKKAGLPLSEIESATIINALFTLARSGAMKHSVAKEVAGALTPQMVDLLRNRHSGGAGGISEQDTEAQLNEAIFGR